MKRFRPVLVVTLAAALSVPLVSACTVTDPPALTVDGWSLNRKELMDQMATLARNGVLPDAGRTPGTGTVPTSYSPNTLAQVLTLQAQWQVLTQDLKRRGQAVTPQDEQSAMTQLAGAGQGKTTSPAQVEQELAKYGSLKEAIVGVAAAQAALGRAAVTDQEVTEQAHKDYEANRDKLARTCVSLVHMAAGTPASRTNPNAPAPTEADYSAAQAKMAAAKAKIDAGSSFADVARTDSDDPQSAANGGEAGCLTADRLQQIPQPVSQVLSTLPVNQTSEPIRIDGDGYYLLDVTSRSTPTFEQVQTDLESQARQQLGSTRVEEATLRAGTGITVSVDPLFGEWDAASLRVIPPRGAEQPSTTLPAPSPDMLGGIDLNQGAPPPAAGPPTSDQGAPTGQSTPGSGSTSRTATTPPPATRTTARTS